MNQPQGWPKARQTLGLMLLAWGIALVIGAAQGGSNPLRPLTASSSSTDSGTPQATLAFQQVDELSALETALSEAASAQQPAFVNFTADWCISCKLMERDVFPALQCDRCIERFPPD